MANQEHLDILARGVEVWNSWRLEHAKTRPDLCDTDLIKAVLDEANLQDADLRGTHLEGAYLRGAYLQRATLQGAVLADTHMEGAHLDDANLFAVNLRGTYLQGAILRGATLMWAQFSNTLLKDADLSEARLGLTDFTGIDFSTVVGLEKVFHKNRSSIGIDTIYLSGGKIPESFLRGCGVPENFILYMKSLAGMGLDFYSVFISYSSADQAFADRLHADLQAKGVRCWFAPHDIKGGRKLHEQIDEAIRIYDKLLLILSDASMGSPWVKSEIANARTKESQQQRQVLFPITLVPFDRIRSWKLFDADTGIDSAREVREYFIPDFSDWKAHDAYTKAFDRLVRDLEAEQSDRTA
jgi:uncharacterized protein YjbI with pentapeptide repeats